MKKEEIVDLYDKERIKIGKTITRSETTPALTYRLIVHVCIFDYNGKMLIQRRHQDKKMGGLWDITCGGAVKAMESSEEAIQRELKEELSISFDFKDIRPILTANFKYGFDDFYIINKNIDLETLSLQEDEVIDARWANKDEVINLLRQGRFVKYKENFINLIFDLNKDDRIVEI